jgi:glutamine synthetase adenylyltransferase
MTVLDSAPVHRALERAADPLTGRAALARLVEAHTDLPAAIERDALLTDALVAVSIASHSLFGVLERDEAAIAMLTDAALRSPLSAEDCAAEAAPCSRRQTRTRRSAVGSTGRSFASPDATCSESPTCGPSAPSWPRSRSVPRRRAVDRRAGSSDGSDRRGQARRRELNYASDVDVLFVHDGESAEAERAARAVLAP